MKLPNLHESAARELSVGHIKGMWRDLGREAGTRTVGLRRIEIAAGHFATPAHEHGGDEEIFFVLAGSGLLWENGKTYEVRGGDCIVHRPLRGAHTLRGGDDGLDVLVLESAATPASPRCPASAWPGASPAGSSSPTARAPSSGRPPRAPQSAPRRWPSAPATWWRSRTPPPSSTAPRGYSARAPGRGPPVSDHVTLPGGQGAPAHCHSEEEEIFVVLDGGGTLQLWPRGGGGESSKEHPLRAGDVVSRLPGTGVAHALRAGEQGLTYLAYGTRAPGDMCFYPQTGRVSLRGLGIALRSPEIEPLAS